jgi:hypothetical protein
VYRNLVSMKSGVAHTASLICQLIINDHFED